MAKTKTTAPPSAKPADTEIRDRVPAPGSDPNTGRRGRLRVRATMVGYYEHIRRREGDVFVIEGTILPSGHLDCFSHKWMEAVAPTTPTRVTTPAVDLVRKHDELLRSKVLDKMGGSSEPVDAPKVVEDNPLGS